MISIIVAASENNVIGKGNRLLWHLPADLKYFKETTYGHPMIMGRKTYESIGKPLPGRTFIIITKQKNYQPKGVIVTHSLKDAIEKGSELNEEIFIAGGGEIYKQAMFLTDRIYLTRVFAEYDGDTFFPELSDQNWRLVKEEHHKADEKNEHDMAFHVYERKE